MAMIETSLGQDLCQLVQGFLRVMVDPRIRKRNVHTIWHVVFAYRVFEHPFYPKREQLSFGCSRKTRVLGFKRVQVYRMKVGSTARLGIQFHGGK